MIQHPINPIYDKDSKILILGSFPSVKSREAGFFYGHPQNRFWKVTAAVCGVETPTTIEEKKAFLLEHHIAVWDVIHSCDIMGSSDSSIKNVVANDLNIILKTADIRQIYVNGKKAEELYKKYIYPKIQRGAICLPSTSPANATWSVERLTEAWKCIKKERDCMDIKALEIMMWEAAKNRDVKAFLEVVREDAVMVCGGYRCSGAEYAGIIAEFDLEKYEISNFEVVEQSTDLCQVHYVISTFVSDVRNKDLEGRFHITSTWKCVENIWKLIFNMDSRIL